MEHVLVALWLAASPQACEADGAKIVEFLAGPKYQERRVAALVAPNSAYVFEKWEGPRTYSVTIRHTSGRMCLMLAGRRTLELAL